MNGKDLFDGIQHLNSTYIELSEFGDFSLTAFLKEDDIADDPSSLANEVNIEF